MMLSLGFFIFEIGTLPYQDLQRRTSWRHAATSRIGARPAFQFLGDDDDSMHISGMIYPALTGDVAGLDTLRDMGSQGDAWPLVAGDGTVHGAFKIDSVQDGRREFLPNGTAKEIEFSLTLFRVDDDQVLSADASGGIGEDLDPVVDYDLDPAVTDPAAD